MRTLTRDVRATLIHGKTSQEVEDCDLLAGTAYTLERTFRGEAFGEKLAHILIEGYRYLVEASAVAR